jgi:hypothetical protein
MNEDILNMEVRKFLKKVGVTSQRELEHYVLKAVEAGKLEGNESLQVTMTLDLPAIGLRHIIEGDISLE